MIPNYSSYSSLSRYGVNYFVPSYGVRHFGQIINEKKNKLRGGYKKRGRK